MSLVEPFVNQITAEYKAILPRRPLRLLLTYQPGAGKTIMAGLIIKELIARGDMKRCLVVCTGSLSSSGRTSSHENSSFPSRSLWPTGWGRP